MNGVWPDSSLESDSRKGPEDDLVNWEWCPGFDHVILVSKLDSAGHCRSLKALIRALYQTQPQLRLLILATDGGPRAMKKVLLPPGVQAFSAQAELSFSKQGKIVPWLFQLFCRSSLKTLHLFDSRAGTELFRKFSGRLSEQFRLSKIIEGATHAEISFLMKHRKDIAVAFCPSGPIILDVLRATGVPSVVAFPRDFLVQDVSEMEGFQTSLVKVIPDLKFPKDPSRQDLFVKKGQSGHLTAAQLNVKRYSGLLNRFVTSFPLVASHPLAFTPVALSVSNRSFSGQLSFENVLSRTSPLDVVLAVDKRIIAVTQTFFHSGKQASVVFSTSKMEAWLLRQFETEIFIVNPVFQVKLGLISSSSSHLRQSGAVT